MPKSKLEVLSAVSSSDRISVTELATLFGFSVSALVEAINRNRKILNKPFYSVSDLAARWDCSRATVLNILRESELKLFNASSKCATKRSSWRISVSVVKHLEDQRMKALSVAEHREEEAA
jgi:predicted DNA-binding protein YlxM (UPF0122 family)